MKTTAIKPLSYLLALFFAAGIFWPQAAQAQSARELTRYISAQDKSVVGVNIESLRKSKYFDQVINWAKQTPEGQELFDTMKAAEIDLTRDIDTFVAGIADFGGEAQPGKSDMTFVLAGKLKQATLLKLAKAKGVDFKESKSGKLTLYSKDNLTLVFPKDGLIWGVSGAEGYRKKAVETLKSSKNTVESSSYFKDMIADTKDKRSLWAIVDMAAAQAPLAEVDPKTAAKTASLSLDLASGMAIDVLLEMATKEGAKAAADELKAQALASAKNPMVAMVGAGPFLKNLKVDHKGTRVSTASSMTSAEFDKLVTVATQMMAAKFNNAAPTPQSATPGAGKKDAPAQKPKKPKKPKKSGANADFN